MSFIVAATSNAYTVADQQIYAQCGPFMDSSGNLYFLCATLSSKIGATAVSTDGGLTWSVSDNGPELSTAINESDGYFSYWAWHATMTAQQINPDEIMVAYRNKDGFLCVGRNLLGAGWEGSNTGIKCYSHFPDDTPYVQDNFSPLYSATSGDYFAVAYHGERDPFGESGSIRSYVSVFDMVSGGLEVTVRLPAMSGDVSQIISGIHGGAGGRFHAFYTDGSNTIGLTVTAGGAVGDPYFVHPYSGVSYAGDSFDSHTYDELGAYRVIFPVTTNEPPGSVWVYELSSGDVPEIITWGVAALQWLDEFGVMWGHIVATLTCQFGVFVSVSTGSPKIMRLHSAEYAPGEGLWAPKELEASFPDPITDTFSQMFHKSANMIGDKIHGIISVNGQGPLATVPGITDLPIYYFQVDVPFCQPPECNIHAMEQMFMEDFHAGQMNGIRPPGDGGGGGGDTTPVDECTEIIVGSGYCTGWKSINTEPCDEIPSPVEQRAKRVVSVFP